MELERIAAKLRPRTGWESIDLGFALARRWFLPLWALWWITAAPTGIAALIWLHDHAFLWLLLIWWLKPMFEATLLFWLSRALFGECLSPSRALEQFGRAFPRRLWPQILWRRIGFTRCLSMPATLLENLHGSARRRRLAVLEGQGLASWLTLICAHLEAVLWIGAPLTLVLLIPGTLPGFDAGELLLEQFGPDAGEAPGVWLGIAVMLLAMSVIAPFYVAAGFALYLGRRTELEAWDLELVFRRVASAERTAPTAPGRAARGSRTPVLVLACAIGLGASGDTASADGGAPTTPDEARAIITEVLAHGDFGATRTESVWVYVGGDNEDGEQPDDTAPPRLPSDWILAIATAFKWSLAAGAAAVMLILLHGLRQGRAALPRLGRGKRSGADLYAETPTRTVTSPPRSHCEPMPAAAARLLAAGDTRGALALMYRTRVESLHAAGLPLRPSATEAECLAAAAALAQPAERDWLARVVALRQAVAYAHAPVERTAVEALIATAATLPQEPAVLPKGPGA
jgi:hypothetical protein